MRCPDSIHLKSGWKLAENVVTHEVFAVKLLADGSGYFDVFVQNGKKRLKIRSSSPDNLWYASSQETVYFSSEKGISAYDVQGSKESLLLRIHPKGVVRQLWLSLAKAELFYVENRQSVVSKSSRVDKGVQLETISETSSLRSVVTGTRNKGVNRSVCNLPEQYVAGCLNEKRNAFLAVLGNRQLLSIDLTSGEKSLLVTLPVLCGVACAPTGRTLIWRMDGSGIEELSREGKLIRISDSGMYAKLSPDGRISCWMSDNGLYVKDKAGKAERIVLLDEDHIFGHHLPDPIRWCSCGEHILIRIDRLDKQSRSKNTPTISREFLAIINLNSREIQLLTVPVWDYVWAE